MHHSSTTIDENNREAYTIEMQIDDVSIMVLDVDVDDRERLVGSVRVIHT